LSLTGFRIFAKPNCIAIYLEWNQCRFFFKIGGGFVNLVKIPAEQYQQDGRLLHGLKKGVQGLAKTLTVEILTLGSRASIVTQKILTNAERAIKPSAEEDGSSYANQPNDLQEGLWQAAQRLSTGITSAIQGVTTEPWKEYQRSGVMGIATSLAQGVPSLVIKPMIGTAGAISRVTLSLRNMVDPQEKLESDAKYKVPEKQTAEEDQNNQPDPVTNPTALPPGKPPYWWQNYQ